MDSFKFHDIRVEKANAISKYRRIQKITTLFRFIELFVFLIVLSRFCTHFFPFSLKLSVEHFRGISITLISPRSVFVLGNAIIIALVLISGQFSGEKNTDFYEEYAEKCRHNQQPWIKEEKKEYKNSVICRSRSTNIERAERRRELRRSMSEKYRKSEDCGKKAAAAVGAGGGGCPYAEEEMSSEEFRRKVEAFIARQQRSLREEEEFSAVVSFEA